MIAPTVLDVSHLIGFPPFGRPFDISTSIDMPFLKDINIVGAHVSYGNFLQAERKYAEIVSDREFFAYILYFLCKMIFCHSGKKIMLEFVPLAYTLFKCEAIDLTSYFLGYVNKVGSDSFVKPFSNNLGGPLWFLQLLQFVYFPDHKVAIKEPLTIYGDKFVDLAFKPLTLVGYLQYFQDMREDK